MPALEQFTNNAVTSLSAAITTAPAPGTSENWTVVSAGGFPAAPQFRIVIDNEILIVTAGAGSTTWTMTRGAEGTTPATHGNGASVAHVLTAGSLLSAARQYDVRAYGATGDGTTDDSAAIQAAIDAAAAVGGGNVFFPAGTYQCHDINLKSNVRLTGEGDSSVLRKGGGTDYIAQAVGTLGTTVALNANGVAGASTVSAATNPAALAAGDYVLIRDTTYKYATTGRNLELNRVLSVAGGGPYTFTLANNLLGSYATASSAEIIKLSAVVGVQIERLKFAGQPPGVAGGLLYCSYAYDMQVRNCAFSGAYQNASIYIMQSAHFWITDCDIRDGYDMTTSHGYGIIVGESSHHGTVTGNYSENLREHAFTDNARCHVFSGNTMRNHYDNAVNTHGSGCERITISNNFVEGCQVGNGIGVGQDTNNAADVDIVVSGNFIDNTYEEGIGVSSGTAGHVMSRVLVANNFVRNWNRHANDGPGIWVGGGGAGYVSHVNIVGNVLAGSTSADCSGIDVYGADDVLVQNNLVKSAASYGIRVRGTCNRVTVQGNAMSLIGAANVQIIATVNSLLVCDNTSDDIDLTGATLGTWHGNLWGGKPDRAAGTASISTAGTIPHGLYAAPTKWGVQHIVTGMTNLYATADATNLTVNWTGGGPQTIKWWAEV